MADDAPINVLIVDDSLVIRGVLTGLFEKDPGLNVIGAAASVEEADAVIANKIVDVVTLDINMPGTNGLAYLLTLKRRHIPAVMLSGSTAEGSEVRAGALLLGAAACFNKADAVKDGPALIQLIKAAALHQVKLSHADMVAMENRQQSLRANAA
jgi:two-component system chemotaxis response regulator CheB